MTIYDLPNELLLIIAGFLGQPDLNTLTQTCQLFHTKLNPTLYFNNIRHHRSSALFWAAATGNCGTVQHMLASGADLEIRSEHVDYTNIILQELNRWAKKRTTKMRQAQARGTLLTCGETPLHRAAERNQEEVVKCLLDLGADMLSVNTNGYYPIQLAARKGHEAVVMLFLEKGYAPNEMGWDDFDPSALHSAVYGGHPGVAKLLLDHGADASLKSTPRYFHLQPPAPLDVALLKADEIPGWPIRPNYYPTGKGIHKGRQECALLLIERGARLTMSDGGSPYLALAAQGNFVKVVQELLSLGFDPNDGPSGHTALWFAKKHKYRELIDILEPMASPIEKAKRKRRASKS